VRGCGGDGAARLHPRRVAPVRGDVLDDKGPCGLRRLPCFGGQEGCCDAYVGGAWGNGRGVGRGAEQVEAWPLFSEAGYPNPGGDPQWPWKRAHAPFPGAGLGWPWMTCLALSCSYRTWPATRWRMAQSTVSSRRAAPPPAGGAVATRTGDTGLRHGFRVMPRTSHVTSATRTRETTHVRRDQRYARQRSGSGALAPSLRRARRPSRLCAPVPQTRRLSPRRWQGCRSCRPPRAPTARHCRARRQGQRSRRQ